MRICSYEKKNKIKQTMAETREKRKGQVCKVFPLKIDISPYKHIDDLRAL